MNTPPRARNAFTLAELIVAVTVTVLLATGTVAMLRGMTASRQRASERMAGQVDAHRAVEIITQAFRNASCHGSQDTLLEGAEGWSGDSPADRVRLFTVRPEAVRRGRPESDVKECEFFVTAVNGLPGALMERIDPTRNERPDGGGVLLRLTDNVAALEISYFDGFDWQRSWPVDPTEPDWPAAVRVSVAVAGDERGGRAWTASRTIAFPDAAPPEKTARKTR